MKFAREIRIDGGERLTGHILDVQRGRDAGALERTNWDVAYAELSPLEGFNEFRERNPLTGWTDLMIVADGSPAHDAALAIEARLEQYPSLDDDALSALEDSEGADLWERSNRRDRLHWARSTPCDVFKSWGNVSDSTRERVING